MQASDLPLLIVFIATIALLYSIVNMLVNSRRRRKYKALFSFVVDKLGHLQIQANALGQIAFKIKNSIVLDYYQSCLNFMQTLSEALTLVSPKGRRPDALDSALVLTKECELRLTKAGELFERYLAGEQLGLSEVYRDNREKHKGCYFCSLPIDRGHFRLVDVRIDGTVRKVLSCDRCRVKLKETKNAKVLHFLQNGKTIHWSESQEYIPSREYWALNDMQGVVNKVQQLTLIPSKFND